MSWEQSLSPRATSRVTWHVEQNAAAEAAGLVLYRIDRDVGSWRLFPADCPTQGMVDGTAIPVLSGYSSCAFGYGRPKWLEPNDTDIARAAGLLARLLRAREEEPQ